MMSTGLPADAAAMVLALVFEEEVMKRPISSLHFGEHLMLDGYGGDPKLLNDRRLVKETLNELCDLLHMHKLAESQVFQAPDNHMKDPGGWSGFVVIMESHISLHTFPRRQFLSADLYTCRNGIDQDFFAEFVKKKFKLQELEVHFQKRGLKYPERNLN